MILQRTILTGVFVAALAGLSATTVGNAAGIFRTRSGRGTHPIPEGYGPRGPVGPSDTDIVVESPTVTVMGGGRRGVPYQAYPPDDSEAFRHAIAEAAQKGGGVVYVPPGTYRIESSLLIPAKITLHGAGRSTHLYTTLRDRTVMFVTAGDGVRFTQLRISGPSMVRTVQNLSRGISVVSPGCRIDHLEISGFGHAAISVSRGGEATVEFIYDHHNTHNGLGYGVSVHGGRVLVTDSEFEQNRHAIASGGAGTYYQCVYSYLHGNDETFPNAALDAHPGMSGEIEVAYNFFEDLSAGLDIADGSGRIHHNLARNVRRFCTLREGVHNGKVVPGAEVHDIVAESNRLENVATPFVVRAGRNIVVDGKKLR